MAQGCRSMPILTVKNVAANIKFYRDGLGFALAGTWDDKNGTPNFAIVVFDGITIGLTKDAKAKGSGEHWAGYFYVTDIAAFVDHVEGQGLKLSRRVKDQDYGCRDCELLDPDGNRLCFGQDLYPSEAGPGL